ncbi:MAG: tetratricopeptide repeat protein [Neomegalonema sp.]|nr:tetratricopeptide repeat protein [Neomegalonema sp.]
MPNASLLPLEHMKRAAIALLCAGATMLAPMQALAESSELDAAMVEAEALLSAGQALRALDRYKQLLSDYAPAFRQIGQSPVEEGAPSKSQHLALQFGRARALEALGRRDEAIVGLSVILRGNSNASELRLLRGSMYARDRHFDRAAEDYSKVIDQLTRKGENVGADLYRAYGDALFAADQNDAAIKAYQQGVAEAPGDLALTQSLALALARSGEVQQAETLLSRLTQTPPIPVSVLRLRASLRVQRGALEQASDDLDRAVAMEPENADHRLARASLAAQRRLPGAALADFEAVLASVPPDSRRAIEARLGAAQALLSQDRPRRALRHLDKVVEHVQGREPAALSALYWRGIAYFRLGLNRASEADLSLLIGLSPNLATAHYQRALTRIASGRLATAAQDLERVIALEPNGLDAHFALARTRLAMGQIAAGEQALAQALEIAAENGQEREAAYQKGLILLAMESPIDAEQYFARSFPSDDLQAELRHIEALGAQQEHRAAAAAASLLSEQHGEDLRLALIEARHAIAAGNLEQGRSAIERAQAQDAAEDKLALLRADLALAQARGLQDQEKAHRAALTMARQHLDTALDLGAPPALVLPKRAALATALGDLQAAKRDLDEIVQADPSIAQWRFARAGLLQRMDRCEDAIREFDTALKLVPEDAAIARQAKADRGRCKLDAGALWGGLSDLIGSNL